MAGYCSASYAAGVGARYASVHSLTSMSPATATVVSNLVKAQFFMPGSSSQAVQVSYSAAAGGASATNNVGSQVIVGVTWTQSISLPGYGKTLSMNSQAYRFITR